MSYLRGFLPWIAFAVLSGVGWEWGAAAALVCAVASLVTDRRAGVTADAQVLDFGTIGYFAALALLAFAWPHSPVQQYAGALSAGWLALIAWSGLAMGRPFTLGIGRRRAARQLWHEPGFVRLNVAITRVWATAFTLSAAALALCAVTGVAVIVRMACQLIGFVLPALITRRMVRGARARARVGGVVADAAVRVACGSSA
jgi:hypothetical protein